MRGVAERVLASDEVRDAPTGSGPAEHGAPGETGGSTGAHAEEADEVRRAAAGDAAAFERLYRRHVGRIHAVVRRLLGDGDADEMTQDVFVRAWEKLHTFRGDAAFGTWLHRLAVNLTLSRRSQAARLRARFPVFDVLPPRAAHTAPAGLGMDFEQAIGALPEGARQVFVLHDVEGFKHHEIAERLGVTVGTSKSQLHRARMELRRWLS